MLCGGAEGDAIEKVDFFAVAAFEPAGVGAPFGENFSRDEDAVARVDGPESFVEHPVSVAREGEAIVRIVVAALGKLMDVRGFDDRAASSCVRSVTGERAGEAVLRHYGDAETGVASFGFVFGRFLADLELLLAGLCFTDAERREQRLLFGFGKPRADKLPTRRFSKVFILETGEEIGIELDAVGGLVRPARPAVIAERLPKALVAQVVERLSESRPSAPALLHESPVGIETQAKVGRLSEFGALQFTAFG